MKLLFTSVVGECCALCNPVHLADFETECIRVRLDHSPLKSVSICRACVRALQTAEEEGISTVELEPEIASFFRG